MKRKINNIEDYGVSIRSAFDSFITTKQSEGRRDATISSYKRSIIDFMKFCEDNIFMLKVLPVVRRAVQSEFDGYYYRAREDSVCGSHFPSAYLIRIFDEIMLFSDDVKAAHVPLISSFLARSVVNWRMRRLRHEHGADEAVIATTRKVIAGGLLRLRHLPLRIRVGFIAIVTFRTFLLLDFLLCLRKGWGSLRSKMRR